MTNLYKYFVVSKVFTGGKVEAELFTRAEMADKSWVVSGAVPDCEASNLFCIDCGEFDLCIDGFRTLEEAETFRADVTA